MANNGTKGARIAAIFLLLFGLVFAVIGGAFNWFSYDFSKNAIATTGIVIDMEVSRSSGSGASSGGPTYKPTIGFIDQSGVKRSGQTFLSSSSYNYNLGAQVAILYDTRNPTSLRIDSWFALWGFGLIFLVVGLATMTGGVVLTRVTKRRAAMASAPTGAEPVTEIEAKPQYSYRASAPKKTAAKRDPTVRRR